MTAPALVMVAEGSLDPSVTQVSHRLRESLTRLRPEIRAFCAFTQSNQPTLDEALDQVIAQGGSEAALVPMQLTHATQTSLDLTSTLQSARERHPQLHVSVSRPLGPELSLLTVLDQRLRTALSQARCLELDGLVLSVPCAGDVRGSSLLARRARQWSTHHHLPCLTAVADESGPSVAQAIMGLRAQGRRHIAVGSFFLAANDEFHTQSDLAYRFGAVAVSDPIGAAREVIDLVLARYAFAAMNLLDFEPDATQIEALPEPHLHAV